MTDIQKSNSEIEKQINPHPEWKPGDELIDVNDSRNPERIKVIKTDNEGITYFRWSHYTDDEDSSKEWYDWNDSESYYKWREFERYHKCIKLEKSWEEYTKEAFEQVQDIEKLKSNLGINEISEETQLATTAGSKEMLSLAKTELEARKNKIEIMKAALMDKVNSLSNIVSDFRHQIEKVEKVLGVVELYLGAHEEIIIIQDGIPADSSEPICVRQRLLYIDEEVGDPTDQGWDFQKLEDWDNWVKDPVHLQQVLPENRGIVAMKVRRKNKCYASGNSIGDAIINATCNAQNQMTYFLIRNGENLYRIWSNISVTPRLFPTKKELISKEKDYFMERDFEKQVFEYKKYGLFLQGLLHRTKIFAPLDENINVFQEESWNGMLKFIRDDESLLPSGKLSWSKWQEEINSLIQVGSRVIYRDARDFGGKGFMPSRTQHLYNDWVSRPGTGLYEIVELDNPEEKKYYRYNYKFLYNPGDEVYTDSGYSGCHERKRKIGFWCYKDEVLNYDQISLEDIEFYINCRTERGDYIEMMPLLYELRRMRKAELEREKMFVQLVASRNKVSEDKVWKLVDWWKFKNKWKRPIDQDDAKALRMIENKLKQK